MATPGKKDREKYPDLLPNQEQRKDTRFYALISLISLLCFVGSGLMMWDIDLLNPKCNMWCYSVPVLMGLASAGFLFGVRRFYARYRGKQFGGRLELVAPIVAFLLVLVLGSAAIGYMQVTAVVQGYWYFYAKDIEEGGNNDLEYLGKVSATDQKERLARARWCFTEALMFYREFAGKDPERYRPDVARMLNTLGILDRDQGRIEEAQKEFAEALQIYRELAQQNPERFSADIARLEKQLNAH
jgi:tetratricopeptide (TPR) repeat protein